MRTKKMAFEWVFAGYIFSQAIQLAKTGLSRTGLFLAAVVILGFILYGFKWLVARKGKQFLSNFASFGRSIKAAAVKNERVALWIQKHPRSVSFLKARFDAGTFSGLPLTLLTLSFVYVAALFAGLVEDLITSDTMVATDHRIANFLCALRTGALTDVFTWITLLGNVWIILAFLAVSVALFWVWRKRRAVLPLLISAAGSTAFTYLGKLTFQRPRPETAVYAAHSYSFPSGHATIAVAFYGFAGYFIARTVHQWNRKVNIVCAAVVLIAALGFSRMYLGEHYLSDVLSGYLVGAMWLIVAISLSEWLRQKAKGDRAESPAAWARPISWGLVFAAGAFYVAFALTYRPPPAATEAEPIFTLRKSTAVFTNPQLKYTRTLTGAKQEPINFILTFSGGHDARLRPARRIKAPTDGRAGGTTAAPCGRVRRSRTKKSADILLKYRNRTDTRAAQVFLLLTEKDQEKLFMTHTENRSPYILVGDDYSSDAQAAAEAAIRLARNQNLAIRGLYVVDEALALDTYANYHAELPLLPKESNGERPEPGSRAELMNWFESQGEVALSQLQKACDEAGVPVTTSLLVGGVPEMVLRYAAGAQMLALGRRGNSHGVDSKSLGHNFRKIAHQMHLPMIVGGSARTSLRRILLAYHGLAHADEALAWTARLQQGLAAEVIVLSVCEDDQTCLSGISLEEIKARLAKSGLENYRFINAQGRPSTAMADIAAANDVDLIILGRYRHGALVEWLVGSTVDRLLRLTSLPILIA